MTDDIVQKAFDMDADIIEEETKPVQSKKKSAKEKFAESTGFVVPEVTETEEQQVTSESFGLTTPTSDEQETEASRQDAVYKASNVENVPAQVREGMHLSGVGRRRRWKQKEEIQPARINRNTVKAFPDKKLGSVDRTTFKG